MGDTNLLCPHCNSAKYKVSIDSKKEIFKKLKGGNWKPLLTKKGSDTWIEDPSEGIAVHCKCGKRFFVYDFKNNVDATTATTIRENQSLAVFCPKCQSAFVSSDMVCPRCSQQF